MMTIEPKRYVWRRSWGKGKRNLVFGFSFFNGYRKAVAVEFWDLKRGIILSKFVVRGREGVEINPAELA